MVTAKGHVDDKVCGLDAGADDYLTKPFKLRELAARVRAVLRRNHMRTMDIIRFQDLEVDIRRFRVTKAGQAVHLLPKELRLLEFFLRHPGVVFSHEELLASVWESDTAAQQDTVRGHIKRLRKKLDTRGRKSIIDTVHAVGYRLGAECEQA